ncbi:EAL domain-containing protein [Arsukibacterium sp.]|uniref:EAL domain-containing protein n=1 Tax=Arsukibacterium sp. TaxID=1977258 RepID=UPI001BD32FE2|nr:EAL domain-containing protein [Arsukibacterium sp.]
MATRQHAKATSILKANDYCTTKVSFAQDQNHDAQGALYCSPFLPHTGATVVANLGKLFATAAEHEPTVSQFISTQLIFCDLLTTVQDAAKLMHKHQVSCILIMEHNKVLGIWTEADAKRIDWQLADAYQQPIKKLMTSPVISVEANTPLNQAASLMLQKRIRRLLVIDHQQQPVGILTQSDIVRQQRIEHYLRLKDVGSSISKPPLHISSSMALNLAVKTMQQHNAEAAIVDFGDEMPGIITERDLIKLIAEGNYHAKLSQLAQRPVLTVTKSCSLLQAVDILKEKNFRHIAVTDEQGLICGLLSFSDILINVEYAYVEQLKQALYARDLALRTSADYLRLAHKVIDASLDGIMITNVHGVIESVNPSFTQLTGYTAAEAIGQTPALLSSGLHNKDFYRSLWQVLMEQGHWQGEIWNKRKNGEIYPEWLSITAIRGENGEICQFAAIFSDISERKSQEKKIHQLAYLDELTGLANRRMFLDRLKLALANAQRHQHQMAVLFLDLDLFKRINDTLGHQAGDEVLTEVARRLTATVREGESVARLGGDEFTILLPEIDDISSLDKIARRLVQQFEKPFRLLEQEFVLTTSIGISLFPVDAKTTDQLIKHADVAMYQAKSAGRNQYCFYQEHIGKQTQDELKLEQALRQALQQHNLQVWYQPKVDLASGKVKGLEALVRWQHHQHGFIAPANFIPLAEKLGLITQLSDQVLAQVCRDIRDYQLQMPVAINVSALQLSDPMFNQRLQRNLCQCGITAKCIELELTESCLIPEQADTTMTLLTNLRQQGFRISIDDFGTGYSSLSYLRRLPIDCLKIDRSFVNDLPENDEDAQIALAIIAMARALGLDVIAEGVEHEKQRNFLLEAGCYTGQGYLYQPALPVAELIPYLQQSAQRCSKNGDDTLLLL